VKDLIAARFIRELGITVSATTEIGRPSIGLQLNPDAGYLISAEIGDYFISVIATNFAFEVVARRYEITSLLPDPKAELNLVQTLLEDVYSKVSKRGKPLFGLAVAVPGLVEVSTGNLIVAPNLGWNGVPLRSIIQQQFNDLPIYIANEANVAAWGESYFRKQPTDDFLLYISSGIGLGGGIVLNGQIMIGATGFAGEVGHMVIIPDGLLCPCGNRGCWETVGNQLSLYRRISEAIQAGRVSLLTDRLGGDNTQLTVEAIVNAAHSGDLVAHEALEETGYWLGVGIANLMNIINPRHVALGGPLSTAHEFLIPEIEKVVRQRVLPKNHTETKIETAIHGADATLMGGIATIHSEVLNNPTKWIG